MTRRAPPLENHSRPATTRRSVHRSRGRWAVLLISIGTLAGCRILPEIEFARRLPLSRSSAPLELENADGMVSRATRVRVSRELAKAGPKVDDAGLLDFHLAAMRDIGAPALLAGNSVELLVDGPRTYRAMFAAIEQAREYIFVESFIFEEAIEGDRRLSALLAAARGRGVRVHVLYDAVGSLTTDEKFLRGLGAAGVALCVFNPLNPLDERFAGINRRDHRKIVIVDGDVAYAGGVNFSQAYRIASGQAQRGKMSKRKSLTQGWRDTHIAVRGTAAKHLEKHFRETWEKSECAAALEPPFDAQAVKAGETLVQIVASTPDDEMNAIYAMLLSVLTYAQESVDVTMAYFVPDDRFEHTLMEAARRGVRVRIILPSYSDFPGVFYAGRAHYDDLLEAGVELYELQGAFLHSKTIAVDGIWSSVGSTNFDWRSFVHNNEISVCVIDEGFAREMARMFDLDLAESKRITLDTWRDRGLRERLKELLWLPIQYWL